MRLKKLTNTLVHQPQGDIRAHLARLLPFLCVEARRSHLPRGRTYRYEVTYLSVCSSDTADKHARWTILHTLPQLLEEYVFRAQPLPTLFISLLLHLAADMKSTSLVPSSVAAGGLAYLMLACMQFFCVCLCVL